MNFHKNGNDMLDHLRKLYADQRAEEARKQEEEEADLLLKGFARTQRKLAVDQMNATYLDSTTIRLNDMCSQKATEDAPKERDWMLFVAGACITAFGILTLIAIVAAMVAQ